MGSQYPCEEARESMKMQQIGIGLHGLPGADCMTCMSFEAMFIGNVEVQEVAKAEGSLSSSQVFVDAYKPGLALLQHEISLAQDLYYGKDDGDRIRPKVTENEAKEARAIVIKAGLCHCVAFFQYCKILPVVVEMEE